MRSRTRNMNDMNFFPRRYWTTSDKRRIRGPLHSEIIKIRSFQQIRIKISFQISSSRWLQNQITFSNSVFPAFSVVSQ